MNNKSKTKIELYEELKDIYNCILDEIVFLLDEYNLKSVLEVSCLYNYLLNNYYFTNRKELDSSNYILNDYDILGINTVINGGVCRHHASMLNDIFHRIKKDSMILIGCCYKDGEKDNMINKNNLLNHSIVIASDNNKLFIDSTNNKYYQLTNHNFILKNSSGVNFIVLKPELASSFGPINKYDDMTMDNYYKMISKKALTESQILSESKDIVEYIKKYNTYLNNYNKSSNQLINEAREKSKLIKKL